MVIPSSVSSRTSLPPFKNMDSRTLQAYRFFVPVSMGPQCACTRGAEGHCLRFGKWWETARVSQLQSVLFDYSSDHQCTSPKDLYSALVQMLDEPVSVPSQRTLDARNGTKKHHSGVSHAAGSENVSEKNDTEITPAVTVAEEVMGLHVINAVNLDIGRTYPSIDFFRCEGKTNIQRVLLAYAFFDPEVGYVQGMNFLVAALLWHSTEEETFWLFVTLMMFYDLRYMFLPGLPGLRKRISVLQALLTRCEPYCLAHLEAAGVTVQTMATDWILTLFAYSIPIGPLAELWDQFFDDGWLSIYRLVVYRISRIRNELLMHLDLTDLIHIVKFSIPPPKVEELPKAMRFVKSLMGIVTTTSAGDGVKHFASLATPNSPYWSATHPDTEDNADSSDNKSAQSPYKGQVIRVAAHKPPVSASVSETKVEVERHGRTEKSVPSEGSGPSVTKSSSPPEKKSPSTSRSRKTTQSFSTNDPNDIAAPEAWRELIRDGKTERLTRETVLQIELAWIDTAPLKEQQRRKRMTPTIASPEPTVSESMPVRSKATAVRRSYSSTASSRQHVPLRESYSALPSGSRADRNSRGSYTALPSRQASQSQQSSDASPPSGSAIYKSIRSRSADSASAASASFDSSEWEMVDNDGLPYEVTEVHINPSPRTSIPQSDSAAKLIEGDPVNRQSEPPQDKAKCVEPNNTSTDEGHNVVDLMAAHIREMGELGELADSNRECARYVGLLHRDCCQWLEHCLAIQKENSSVLRKRLWSAVIRNQMPATTRKPEDALTRWPSSKEDWASIT
eukprot:Selendium_serpulae@DN6387_c0_g1_i15.p1